MTSSTIRSAAFKLTHMSVAATHDGDGVVKKARPEEKKGETTRRRRDRQLEIKMDPFVRVRVTQARVRS